MPLILNRIRNGETIAHYETVRRHKDGTEIPISLTVSPIKDSSGRIIGACKIARNIAERSARNGTCCKAKLMSRPKLLNGIEREMRFRLVVEAAPNALIMMTADGHISLVNSQTEKLFGYKRWELVGQKVEMLLPERFRGSQSGSQTGQLTDAFFALEPKPCGQWSRPPRPP